MTVRMVAIIASLVTAVESIDVPIRRRQPATPLVSVITAVFDGEDTIESTVLSVRDAPYRPIEHIVVDDGSTDSTPQILSRLAAMTVPDGYQIRVVSQSNAGRSAARNAGTDLAKGDLVVFLDADERLEPRFLTQTVKVAQRAPGSSVVCGYEEVEVLTGRRTVMAPGFAANASGPEVFARTALTCPFHNSVLIDSTELRASGGFDSSLAFAEDWDLWQRMARRGGHFFNVDETLATYRLEPRTISSNVAAVQYEQGRRVIEQAFGLDNRVSDALPELRNGLASGSPIVGLVWLWTWFAGIECAQLDHYDWLDEERDRLARLAADGDPKSDGPASPSVDEAVTDEVFRDGLRVGRGSQPDELYRQVIGDDGGREALRRVTELVDAGLVSGDPVARIRRSTVPPRLPFVTHDRIDVAWNAKTMTLPPDSLDGTVTFWWDRNGLMRRVGTVPYSTTPGQHLRMSPIKGFLRSISRPGLPRHGKQTSLKSGVRRRLDTALQAAVQPTD